MPGAAYDLTKSLREAWRPPRRLTLSEWSDKYARLSAESSADAGNWRTLPYQRGMLDAMTDPTVERVIVIKSARVGYTKAVNNLVGYHMHQDPCPIMVVQPTVEDAEGYSKEEIATMIRDTPALAGLVVEGAKKSASTILHKQFKGGSISMVGANSPRGFRRVSRRVVVFDEVDGYPASAGKEGDPIKLGIKRSEYYWNRKIVAGSTPTLKAPASQGGSRIEELFLETDQRYYFVPCPHCGEYQVLKWGGPDKPFGFKWEPGNPASVYYLCDKNGCVIRHESKRWMVERGEWRATAVGRARWAGFHIWAAYSYSPNADWQTLVEEFLEAVHDPLKLQTFVNTVLGETWEERGERADEDVLEKRREDYGADVPNGVGILTAFVDVQTAGAGRLECSVWGFGHAEESWLISHEIVDGDPTQLAVWLELDEILTRQYEHVSGRKMVIRSVLIDSGDGNVTEHVYRFTKPRETRTVHGEPQYVSSSKGDHGFDKEVIGRPRFNNRYHARLFMIGVDSAKLLFTKRLQIGRGADGNPHPGFVHMPDHVDREYLEQLTAEKLVPVYRRGAKAARKWVQIRSRNEGLDCAVGSIAALYMLGRRLVSNLGELAQQMMLAPDATPAAPNAAQQQSPEPAADKPRGSWMRPGAGGGWMNSWRR